MPKFCPNCGSEISDKVKFCPECGSDFDSFSVKKDEKPIVEETKKDIKIEDKKIEKRNIDYPIKKNVITALGCSLVIPGLGQIYNGDTYKAVGLGFGILIFLFLFKPLIFLIWLIGIVDAYYTADQINKERIPFKPTDTGDMIIYAVLFIFIIGGLFAFYSSMSSGLSTPTSVLQNQNSNTNVPIESQTDRNIRIANEIVANYHKSHTYSSNDFYVCGDMASDIWDMLKAQGINAKINVGSVDKDITNIKDATHVWVLAEVAPNQYLALEATGGYSVQKTDNPRYYTGWSFYSPKQLKNYQQLSKQYNDAVSKYNTALSDYNSIAYQYNNAGVITRLSLKSQVEDKALLLQQRTQDLNQISQQISALLSSL